MALKNDNIQIMSLQAADIICSGLDKNNTIDNPLNFKFTYEFKEDISQDKKYKGSLSYSLDLIELDYKYPNSIKTAKNKTGKDIQLTDDIIDVSFDYPLFEIKNEPKYKYKPAKDRKKEKLIKYEKSFGKIIFNENELRDILYATGFYIGEVKYVLYKRSSSKSRNGQTLFINSKMYDKMILWSRMGLQINDGDNFDDLPSLKAYESLTLSGLENNITINPHEILFINDIEHSFNTVASVSKLLDGELITKEENIERANSIFDGQALLDESVFNQYEFSTGKGMMLLRNRFFKSCAFNTKLQKFFC